MTLRLGSDTGGTFTDLVVFDEQTGRLSFHKVASTPGDPDRAIVEGMTTVARKIGVSADALGLLVHGTTVATNTVLQRNGAKVALITTAGFRDVLHIQRQDRPRMYDLRARRARPLVPRHLRLELNERMRFDGTVKTPVDHEELERLVRYLRREAVEAVSVGLLHSYANSSHEIEVGDGLRRALPGIAICLSHEVVGEHGEYERFSTCVMNAFVQPVMKRYVSQLERRLDDAGFIAPLFVMKSNGGVMSAEVASRQCVETILSGPAGGVVAGAAMAKIHDNHNLITADMGGTSFDVSVIHEGRPAFARDSEMGGLALAVPMLDIHTVGAGGGSIAWTDAGGSLRVGPRSAGAVPGPACYGLGGKEPTVTDANLVLGRLSPTSLLGGQMKVDLEAARRAIHDRIASPLRMTMESAAEGIIRVVNTTMTGAIRKLTVARGHDPREFTLCPFGGAGPLHGADLAVEMGICETMIPIAPGVTSAVGLLMSNLREDRVRTHVAILSEDELRTLESILDGLARDASASLAFMDSDRNIHRALGMRYHGQRYELPVPLADGELHQAPLLAAFHREHEKMYGYCREDESVEVSSAWVSVEVDLQAVTLPRIRSADAAPAVFSHRPVIFGGVEHDVQVFRRNELGAGARLVGPAVVEQLDATTLVWPKQSVRVDEFGQMILGPKRV